jgi:two-component system LytT family sensor kinase
MINLDLKYLRKLGLRILIVNLVFIAIKLSIEPDPNEAYINRNTIYYYLTAIVLFLVGWEVNDYQIKNNWFRENSSEIERNIKILLVTVGISTVLAALIYYLGIFQFSTLCGIETMTPWNQFMVDMLRATFLALCLCVFNQFYWISKDKTALELSVAELKEEMMSSRYHSLKAQISPHFLFNSLNTLTSLMYVDRDLASDFVSRLASCYRYILDHREQDLISLEKELQFLDSFVFMMTVRHKQSISIQTDVANQYLKYKIPTLSIQMLVENALKHNYYSKEQPIEIEIRTSQGFLVITNNIRRREEEHNSTGLGLSNIKKRYTFYTDREVKVYDDGTTFEISLPLLNPERLGVTQKENLLHRS